MIVKIMHFDEESVIECDEYSVEKLNPTTPQSGGDMIRWSLLRKKEVVYEKTLHAAKDDIKIYITDAGKTIDKYSYPERSKGTGPSLTTREAKKIIGKYITENQDEAIMRALCVEDEEDPRFSVVADTMDEIDERFDDPYALNRYTIETEHGDIHITAAKRVFDNLPVI